MFGSFMIGGEEASVEDVVKSFLFPLWWYSKLINDGGYDFSN